MPSSPGEGAYCKDQVLYLHTYQRSSAEEHELASYGKGVKVALRTLDPKPHKDAWTSCCPTLYHSFLYFMSFVFFAAIFFQIRVLNEYILLYQQRPLCQNGKSLIIFKVWNVSFLQSYVFISPFFLCSLTSLSSLTLVQTSLRRSRIILGTL